MKHRARVYFPIAFFTWLVVVISPLFASSASTQHPVTEELPFFENLARSAIASAQVKPKLAHLCTEFSRRVQDILRKRYGK
jgi:hypothetical protein